MGRSFRDSLRRSFRASLSDEEEKDMFKVEEQREEEDKLEVSISEGLLYRGSK